MLTTIENPVKKKRKELPIKSTRNVPFRNYQQGETKWFSPMINAGLVVAGLSMAILMSVRQDGLFLKELIVSTSIIVMVLMIKLNEIRSSKS